LVLVRAVAALVYCYRSSLTSQVLVVVVVDQAQVAVVPFDSPLFVR
jgi:hypothetical protein